MYECDKDYLRHVSQATMGSNATCITESIGLSFEVLRINIVLFLPHLN